MPKGHRTPPEKKEQVIALARTSMTQEEIAKTVGISRRQVVRILDEAGVSRGGTRRRSEDSRRGVVPVASPERIMASLPHQQALFDLAVRLRDEMVLPLPHEVTRPGAAHWTEPWRGPIDEPPRLMAEEEPLCRFLMDHLRESAIWQHLETLRQGIVSYRDTARRLAIRIVALGQEEAEALGTDIWSKALTAAFVPAVMLDAYYRVRALEGIEFTYRLKATEEAGRLGLRLNLGEGSVRVDSERQADLIRKVHERVRNRVGGAQEVQALAGQTRELETHCEAFQRELEPDDRIRKWLAQSRCELCP